MTPHKRLLVAGISLFCTFVAFVVFVTFGAIDVLAAVYAAGLTVLHLAAKIFNAR